MKTMLERAIPIQQAFIRVVDGETHHVQRSVARKKAVIVAYGDIEQEEQDLFRRLVARNARNMNFQDWKVFFCQEAMVNDTVKREVEAWDAL